MTDLREQAAGWVSEELRKAIETAICENKETAPLVGEFVHLVSACAQVAFTIGFALGGEEEWKQGGLEAALPSIIDVAVEIALKHQEGIAAEIIEPKQVDMKQITGALKSPDEMLSAVLSASQSKNKHLH